MAPRRDPPPSSQSRRSARINKAEGDDLIESTLAPVNQSKVTKSKPKPRSHPRKYDCTTCGRTLADSSFPKYASTDTCNHLINTCRTCLKQWIAIQIESITYDNITCPECPETMRNDDIKLHASADIYKKFDELERRGIADKTPGWRWCLAPRCRAGQVHHAPTQAPGETKSTEPEARVTRQSKKQDETRGPIVNNRARAPPSVAVYRVAPQNSDQQQGQQNGVSTFNICTCNECGAKACVTCDKPWHEGETCEVYQTRMKNSNAAKEEAASLKTIQEECKQCPRCKKNIQRDGGCDHMVCSQCQCQFCFLCLETYDNIGRIGHGRGCRYARAGAIDPHNLGPPPMAVGAGVALGILGGVAAFWR